MNRFISYFGFSVFFLLTPTNGQESIRERNATSIQGKFPIDNVISINTGHFRNEDFQDLLVTHEVDTIKISTGFQFRTGHYTLHQKTLLRFVKGKFEIFWQSPPYISKSNPRSCIYRPAWCHGNFDKDPLLEIVEFENGTVFLYDFDQGVVAKKRKESSEGVIDQAIGWNYNEKGEDEVLALKFSWEDAAEKIKGARGAKIQNRTDVDCRSIPNRGYRISVLTVSSEKVTEAWAKEFDEISSFSPIGGSVLFGKMAIDGSGAFYPALREPQSDVSGSQYIVVSKIKDRDAVEIKRPFPVEGRVLPVGDLAFLQYDQQGIKVHGTFLKMEKELRISKSIGIFQNGKWASLDPCEKAFPGTLSKFVIDKNHKGWIHVHEGEFQFWKELPNCEG